MKMKKFKFVFKSFVLVAFLLSLTGCPLSGSKNGKDKSSDTSSSEEIPRLVMFVGVDISGSFAGKRYYTDALKFLSNYIYSHLKGYGGLERPAELFVSEIGGSKSDERKTFFPIENFQHRSIAEIEASLNRYFPKSNRNPYTDFNAFFKQISLTVHNRKLMLKPISVVVLTDGKPDTIGMDGKADYKSISFEPLEDLARDVTVRILYTTADVGILWQTMIPRQKVKVWTQDQKVMDGWKNRHIFQKGKDISKQDRFFDWILKNVDFKVARKRVD